MENVKRNNLKKPKSELYMLFIPLFISLIGIGVGVMGFLQEERNMGLMVCGGVVAGLMALLTFAILMQEISNNKKFELLETTTNIHEVEVLEIKTSYGNLNGKRRINGYYAVCKFENKELYSEVVSKNEIKLKAGDKVNLYLPESGLKHNALLKVCYDYYVDIYHSL